MTTIESSTLPKYLRFDLTGQPFGRWTVTAYAGSSSRGMSLWHCVCACGALAIVRSGNLKNGHTQSCGCFNKERQAELHFQHGLTDTFEHRCWQNMIRRCEDIHLDCYKNYGGRGIAVCERWRSSFLAFIEDVGMAPSHDHSIERIDNNGDYELKNCRWATPREQSRNKRNNIWLTLNGRTECLQDWAREIGIDARTLRSRMKSGWSDEDTLLMPLQKNQYL